MQAPHEDKRKNIVDFLRLSNKEEDYGLDVDVDKSTKLFFIKDIATNTVVAPPPMNTASVTAWLEDYMKEADEENSAT